MKLNKTVETYSIDELLDNNWVTTGNVTKDGENISINLEIFLKVDSELAEDGTIPASNEKLGTFNWKKDYQISSKYSIFNDTDEKEFIDVCLEIINNILSDLNN